MKKYFIVSDIHSFFEPFKKALDEAGFDENNPNHILVIAGDIFDRGEDTVPLYDYLRTLNTRRLILIRGNHEDLYLDLLKKSYPEDHDFSNGTVKTFCHISNIPNAYDVMKMGHIFRTGCFDKSVEMWPEIIKEVKKSPITKWIKSKKWKNYIEIGDYIITHSFIPLDIKDKFKERAKTIFRMYGGMCGEKYKFQLPIDFFKYYTDWRTKANEIDWYSARWGCPFDLYDKGLFQKEINKGKKLVFGHWHCSEGHERYDHIKEEDCYSIYQNKDIISIDACTVISNKTNVFIIQND